MLCPEGAFFMNAPKESVPGPRRRHGLHILRFPASGKAQSFRRSSFPHEKHASRVVEKPRIRFAAAVWAAYATWYGCGRFPGAPFKGSCRRRRLRGRATSARFVRCIRPATPPAARERGHLPLKGEARTRPGTLRFRTITHVPCTHHTAAAKRIRGFGGGNVRKFRDSDAGSAYTRFKTG